MKLATMAKIFTGHHLRGRAIPHSDGTHRLLQIGDFDESRQSIRLSHVIQIRATETPSDILLQPGDVLFLAKGSRNFAYALGAVAGPTLAAAHFFVLRPKEGRVLPEYLAWYLNQESVRRYLRRNTGQGVHMPVVRREVLENIEIQIPSLEKQRAVLAAAALMNKEQELLRRLAGLRKDLTTAVCLQAIKDRKRVRS